MNALEILLAESQERMVYEVRPENTDAVADIAERFDLGCSVIGEVTDGNYVCTFDGETVVDAPAEYLADGAPMNDLDSIEPEPQTRDLPDTNLESAFETVLESPNTASKEWVYRQYDHEVGNRTAKRPGDDAALLAVRDAEKGVAFSSGADPNWTDAAPYDGARAVALENATNLAAMGATPLAAVDCLNGGNPEKPDVYGGFRGIVDGLADMCSTLETPVVGGNVSLYNDSATGPIAPTPTLAVVGSKDGYDAPGTALEGDGTLLLVGDTAGALGGSQYLASHEGTDTFPTLPDEPRQVIEDIAAVAELDSTSALHDVSHGGLAVALAEMVTVDAGLTATLDADALVEEQLFCELPGRAVVETTDPEAVREAVGSLPVTELGVSDDSGVCSVTAGTTTLEYNAEDITQRRGHITRTLD